VCCVLCACDVNVRGIGDRMLCDVTERDMRSWLSVECGSGGTWRSTQVVYVCMGCFRPYALVHSK
jgi:hypothetical protein